MLYRISETTELYVSSIVPAPHNYNLVPDNLMRSLEISIKEGIIQPIIVREMTPPEKEKFQAIYMLIDGEHRWVIAKKLGLDKISAVIISRVDGRYITYEENLKLLMSIRENRGVERDFTKMLQAVAIVDNLDLPELYFPFKFKQILEVFEYDENEYLPEIKETADDEKQQIPIDLIFRTALVDENLGMRLKRAFAKLRLLKGRRSWSETLEDLCEIIENETRSITITPEFEGEEDVV